MRRASGFTDRPTTFSSRGSCCPGLIMSLSFRRLRLSKKASRMPMSPRLTRPWPAMGKILTGFADASCRKTRKTPPDGTISRNSLSTIPKTSKRDNSIDRRPFSMPSQSGQCKKRMPAPKRRDTSHSGEGPLTTLPSQGYGSYHSSLPPTKIYSAESSWHRGITTRHTGAKGTTCQSIVCCQHRPGAPQLSCSAVSPRQRSPCLPTVNIAEDSAWHVRKIGRGREQDPALLLDLVFKPLSIPPPERARAEGNPLPPSPLQLFEYMLRKYAGLRFKDKAWEPGNHFAPYYLWLCKNPFSTSRTKNGDYGMEMCQKL